jgi:phosphatidylinositol kinase/protein kinase (PI-3  family)
MFSLFCFDNFLNISQANDDVRLDAVMQQVLHLVNSLLDSTPATHKRNMRIRTYKVRLTSQ